MTAPAERDDAARAPRAFLELKRLDSASVHALAAFLAELERAPDGAFFRPHPFDVATLERLAAPTRLDLHYVLVEDTTVLSYGLLRGWEEGYEVPSLGIAVHPGRRGAGLARMMMLFLHAAARMRGATRVRLRVRHDNHVATRLYESLGYSFDTDDGDHRVGILSLDGP